jgi:hypothetical protein
MPKKKITKQNPFRLKKIYLIILLLLLLTLFTIILLWLLIEINAIKNPFTEINYTPRLYVIKDDCTLIQGQLIHSIKDESICELRCKSDCTLRSMSFVKSEFNQKTDDCSTCNCYCK